MNSTHHDPIPSSPSETSHASFVSRPLKLTVLMVLAIGAFYLLREHWNHVAGNWVYLLLLACPVMHLFHQHGSHAGHGDAPGKQADPYNRSMDLPTRHDRHANERSQAR
ncbi:MAG: DUF2933 domain-containing protein [Pseudomonadota bacterium]